MKFSLPIARKQKTRLSSPPPELSDEKRSSSALLEILLLVVICLVALRYYLLDVSMLIPSLAALVLIGAWLCRELSEHARWKRKMLLKSFRRQFRRGEGVIIDGEVLRYDTELTTYVMTVGIIISDIRIFSNYTLRKESLPSVAILYSFFSVIFGWFSIFGPFTTLQTILENFQGSRRESVAMIIDRARFNRYLIEEITRLEAEESNLDSPKHS